MDTTYDIQLPDGTEIQTGATPPVTPVTPTAPQATPATPPATPPAAPQDATPAAQPPQTAQATPQTTEAPIVTPSLTELLKNPTFNSEYNKALKKAIDSALSNRREKEERIRNRELTFEQRTAGLDGNEYKEACQKLFLEQQEEFERAKEQDQLRKYAVSSLSEKSLPETLIDMFDFIDDSQDSVDRKICVIENYHVAIQAEYDKKLADEQSKWRIQAPPEQHGQAGEKAPIEEKLKKYPKRRT